MTGGEGEGGREGRQEEEVEEGMLMDVVMQLEEEEKEDGEEEGTAVEVACPPVPQLLVAGGRGEWQDVEEDVMEEWPRAWRRRERPRPLRRASGRVPSVRMYMACVAEAGGIGGGVERKEGRSG